MGQDVEIADVSMRFGDFYAARDINVHIEAGEFFSFLGPSGCGKTTLLRLVSGFMDPTKGQIKIGGKDMLGIGSNNRPTAMIFQNLALFPLMTVMENIGFGLEVRGMPKVERIKKVEELIELVDLFGTGNRYVSELSGGQMQRVAIARALAVNPAVLLLDEPLSALDLKLRHHMRAELRNIQRRTGVTFIYITHDQTEALTMSDRVGVMSIGKLEQVAVPDVIYNNPATAFVASFVGETNRLQGTISNIDGEYAVLNTASGPFSCKNPQRMSKGEEGTIFIRPETVFMTKESNASNLLACGIQNLSFEGAYAVVTLKTEQGQLLTMRLNNDGTAPSVKADENVNVTFNRENAFVLKNGDSSSA
ncbi:MAG: ABC transporter ATP-binding protein [Deltaproteobacteria bacterium]|nr:ABC transporter ATP-binding protein [Deltaproteobacteria bacterium]MBW2175943.1 ABC transporter ATP-binding protein [Deltaproteobacteria bacterium]